MPPKTLTPQQVQQIRSQGGGGMSTSSAPKVLSADQVRSIRSQGAPASPTGEFLGEKNKFLSALGGRDITRGDFYNTLNQAPATDQNVRRGEGSGQQFERKDGSMGTRRTFKDVLGNVGNAFEDAEIGAAKFALSLPTNLARAATQFGGQNAAKNMGVSQKNVAGTPEAKVFDDAYAREGTFQKLGAVTGQVATVINPATAAGGAVAASTRAIPTIANAASKVGAAGRAARAIPGLTGALTEGIITDAALTGDVDEGTVGFSLGIPAALGALRGARSWIKGADATAKEAGERFIKDLSEGKPEAVGKFKEARQSFVQSIKDSVSSARNKLANRSIDRANKKLIEGEYIAPDDDVAGVIFDETGGLDSVDANGRFVTKKAQQNVTESIAKHADESQKLFNSSNHTFQADDLRTELAGIGINEPTGSQEKAVREILARKFKPGKTLKPGELFDLSKKLRADAYNAQVAKETQKAEAYRKMAAVIDNKLYNEVPDVDSALAQKLRDRQAELYSARDVLINLEDVKAPTAISNRTASLFGGLMGNVAGGYGLGGLVGGTAGIAIAPRINQALNIAYGNKKISNKVLNTVSAYVNDRKFQELAEKVSAQVERNSLKTMADDVAKKAAQKLEIAKKNLRDYITKIENQSKNLLPEPKTGSLQSQVNPSASTATKVPPGGFGRGDQKFNILRDYLK